MSGPYDEFPDVLPVAKAPMVFIAQTSYDNRREDAWREVQYFRERQVQLLARTLFANPDFYVPAPVAGGAPWLTVLRFEAYVLTQKEWDAELAAQYNKGVQAAQRMYLR